MSSETPAGTQGPAHGHAPAAPHVHGQHIAPVDYGHAHAGHGHGHGHGDEADHGSFKSYMTGFVLSVVLTAIPFWMVMTGALPSAQWTGLIVMVFAVVQIVVHMIYFLHMNRHSESGWTFLAMLFTIVVVAITLVGSLWVMANMNANMMPSHMDPGGTSPQQQTLP